MHCDPESCYSLDHAVSLCNENKVPEWPTCLEDAPIAFKRVECLPKIEAPGFFFLYIPLWLLEVGDGDQSWKLYLAYGVANSKSNGVIKKKNHFLSFVSAKKQV